MIYQTGAIVGTDVDFENECLPVFGGLTGCGKMISARENFDGPPCGTTGEHPCRMLKKSVQQVKQVEVKVEQ